MDLDMLISIIIPTYNVEAYIESCLNSIYSEVNSKNNDIEIIAIDDCSTDNSFETVIIVMRY